VKNLRKLPLSKLFIFYAGWAAFLLPDQKGQKGGKICFALKLKKVVHTHIRTQQ